MTMIRTNLHLTVRQLGYLGRKRTETGLSVAEILRRLIDKEIEKDERSKNNTRY